MIPHRPEDDPRDDPAYDLTGYQPLSRSAYPGHGLTKPVPQGQIHVPTPERDDRYERAELIERLEHPRTNSSGGAGYDREPPAPPLAASRPRSDSFLTPLIWLLGMASLLVLGRLLIPPLVEEVQVALVRGRQRAEHDGATTLLKGEPLKELSRAFQNVSRKVYPSVVHIDVATGGRRSSNRGPVYGSYGPELTGQGTGVIMDERGYVVTNYHVVRGASLLDVTLADGRNVRGHLLGTDPATDLAVIKIEASKLIPAQWGDSTQLEPGSPVWAMGSPYGLDNSVTFGIVSAKGRAGQAGDVRMDFIQTDAAVNPGNSGGPLVDETGRVVGINTAILGRSWQGISFSIPAEVAKNVYARLITGGGKPDMGEETLRVPMGAIAPAARGWLGVTLDEVESSVAEQLKLPAGGTVIREIYTNADGESPATDAGLKSGDIVVRWGTTRIDSSAALSIAVAATPPGERVKVTIYRDGNPLSVTVRTGLRPEVPEESGPPR